LIDPKTKSLMQSTDTSTPLHLVSFSGQLIWMSAQLIAVVFRNSGAIAAANVKFDLAQVTNSEAARIVSKSDAVTLFLTKIERCPARLHSVNCSGVMQSFPTTHSYPARHLLEKTVS
jgi:hypothetical protein